PRKSGYLALWRIPFLGGTPRRLVERLHSAVGWSPDGRRMAFVRSSPTGDETHLIVADSEAGNERVLLRRHAPSGYFLGVFSGQAIGQNMNRPAWSADGRRIALLAVDGLSQQVVVVEVDTGAERDIKTSVYVYGSAVWLDAATIVINGNA